MITERHILRRLIWLGIIADDIDSVAAAWETMQTGPPSGAIMTAALASESEDALRSYLLANAASFQP